MGEERPAGDLADTVIAREKQRPQPGNQIGKRIGFILIESADLYG